MSRRDRQRRRDRNRGHPVRRVVLLTLVLSLVGVGLGVAGVAAWVVNVADSAPNINHLKPHDPGQLSEIFASDLPLSTPSTLMAESAGWVATVICRVVAQPPAAQQQQAHKSRDRSGENTGRRIRGPPSDAAEK